MPGKTRDYTLAQNIMFKYKLVGFELERERDSLDMGFAMMVTMPNELSLLLTPAISYLEVD